MNVWRRRSGAQTLASWRLFLDSFSPLLKLSPSLIIRECILHIRMNDTDKQWQSNNPSMYSTMSDAIAIGICLLMQ